MILYIIIAAVLLVNVINPRILWYIDSWKYKSFQKEAPSSLYLFLCRLLSALGLMILILVIYFQPMHLADLADPTSELSITRQHIYVENGEPEIDTESYNDLSEDQTRRIIDSLQQYTYRRTPGTLFSDGSLSDFGEWMICIYIYRDNELVNTVIVSDAGDISVNDRCYSMQDSSELIQQITEIL